jgi:hypothetical protein
VEAKPRQQTLHLSPQVGLGCPPQKNKSQSRPLEY